VRLQATPWDRRRPIAFLHIPKSAGTALRLALEQTLAPFRSADGLCREHFGAFDRFDTMAPAVRARVFVTADELPSDSDLISGHICDGFLRQRYPAAQFVTLLREPRVRLLSLWAFCRTLSDDFLAPWGAWAERIGRARRPLSAFLADRELASVTDNVAVRMLLGPHPAIPRGDVITPDADTALLGAAQARLAGYAFVDIVDNPDVARNLQGWLGRPVTLPRVNETPAHLGTQLDRGLDRATIDLLAARGRLDAALWRAIAIDRMRDANPDRLADAAFATAVARHTADH
jgi:hypothetical protein